VIRISDIHTGVGSEHPLCDTIQLIMIILFFVVLGADTLCFFFLDYSTVIGEILYFPFFLIPGIFFLVLSLYLITKSHNAIFGTTINKPKLITYGVYGWIRHPMYLGILLFCLSFLCFSPSVLSLVVWITFFIIYEKMTVYEEKELVRILSEEYISYQNQVPKWFLGMKKHSK